MYIIQTRSNNILSKEYLKWIIKRLIGRKDGPMSVYESLVRGFDELNIKYRANSNPERGDIVIVLSGKFALYEAIKLKKDGIISKLVAGPNIYSSPIDDNKMIYSKEIDTILVPAEWVYNLWANISPDIKDKIKVWPSGVKIGNASTRDGEVIIYNKIDSDFYKTIERKLENIGISYTTFKYRNFKQGDFFAALLSAPLMFYLSKSESQGLAIQEAWSKDVPTIILKSNTFKSNYMEWSDEKINAPYLNDELGYFFNNIEELDNLIKKSKNLNPQKYCRDNLSDSVCAKKLIEMI